MRSEPINLFDYEARAKPLLPHNNWEFIEAGAMDEITTARNRSAFEEITLRPRFLIDATERKIATTVLGEAISFPVMISPTDGHGLAHPEGECATARGAGMSKTLMMCSTSSHCSLEEIAAAATGPLWFQLSHRGYAPTENLVRRARPPASRLSSSLWTPQFPRPKSATYETASCAPGKWATSASS